MLSAGFWDLKKQEIYVFSDDAAFDKVKGAPNRVYYLHFKTFGEKYFFWFQDADETKDEQHKKLINNFINDIEEEKKQLPAGLPASMNLGSNIFQGMPRNLRGQAGAAVTPTPFGGSSSSANDYQNLLASLQSMSMGGGARNPGATPNLGGARAPHANQPEPVFKRISMK